MSTSRQEFDCCGIIKYLSSFSMFQPDYTCHAERRGIVSSLSTPFDQAIHENLLRSHYQYSKYAEHNPHGREVLLTNATQLQRSAVMLSRLFVKNAMQQGLKDPFAAKHTILILDVGCENALSLPGILAYFGADRVQYIGVDNNFDNIDESRAIYKDFPNISFIRQDGAKYLTDHTNKFDVILFQHPNLVCPDINVIRIFRSMYLLAPHSLQAGGVLYSTFYFETEAELFNRSIKPYIELGFKSDVVKTNRHIVPMLVDSRKIPGSDLSNRYVEYFPENYVLSSQPKLELDYKMKKTN